MLFLWITGPPSPGATQRVTSATSQTPNRLRLFFKPSVRGSHSPGVHLAHSIQTGSAQGNEGEYHWQPEFAGGGEAIPCKEDDLCQFGQRLRHAASLELRIRGPTSRAGRCVRRCETICGTLGGGLPAEFWS